MATVLKTPTIRVALPPRPTTTESSKSEKPFCVSFRHSTPKHSRLSSLRFSRIPSLRFVKFVPFASSGDTETTDTQEEVQQPQQAEAWQHGIYGSFENVVEKAERGTTKCFLLAHKEKGGKGYCRVLCSKAFGPV